MGISNVGADTIDTYEPAHPTRLVSRFEPTSDEAVDDAIERAAAAQGEWARSATHRSNALHLWANALERDSAQFVDVLVREAGKPISEARGEVTRGVAIVRYYAQAVYDAIGEEYPSPDGQARLRAIRLPLGCVALVTPWNFPFAIPLWKIAPALAYGNVVVWKPSSLATAVTAEITARATEVLPEGVVTSVLLEGSRATRLVDHPRIHGVSFTGSAEVGRQIAVSAAQRGIPYQAEMGGQNPSIVLGDADLDHAATTIAGAAMAYAGQKCTATSRVLVERSVAERFVPLLVDRVNALRVGEPSESDTVVGPLISEHAREEVMAAINGARHRGAEVLAGGTALDREGWFMQPTLMRVADSGDPIAQEETFGPVASVLLFETNEEAIRTANSTRYGLSAAVFGSDVRVASEMAARLSAGMVRVNASTTGVDFYAPFGGEGASSYGPKEQGRAAREFYTKSRTIVVNSLGPPW